MMPNAGVTQRSFADPEDLLFHVSPISGPDGHVFFHTLVPLNSHGATAIL